MTDDNRRSLQIIRPQTNQKAKRFATECILSTSSCHYAKLHILTATILFNYSFVHSKQTMNIHTPLSYPTSNLTTIISTNQITLHSQKVLYLPNVLKKQRQQTRIFTLAYQTCPYNKKLYSKHKGYNKIATLSQRPYYV